MSVLAKRTYKAADERREQILDCALQVFADRGYHGASIADVCARAGIGRATLYQYFDDKRDVLVALADRITRRVADAVAARPPLSIPEGFLPTEAQALQVVTAQCVSILRVVFADAASCRLLLRAGRGADGVVDDLLRGIDAAVLSVIEADLLAAQRAGVLRPVDVHFTALFFLGGIEKTVLDCLDADRAVDDGGSARRSAELRPQPPSTMGLRSAQRRAPPPNPRRRRGHRPQGGRARAARRPRGPLSHRLFTRRSHSDAPPFDAPRERPPHHPKPQDPRRPPMTPRKDWPPYELVEVPEVAAVQEKSRRLERLYHLTQERAWDGRAVLAALVEKHGPPGRGMDPATRRALVTVLSVLLWGELAAWSISADLALAIDDMDAKMAATGQVFDEARHFYVMRDYLLLLAGPDGGGESIPIPRLGSLGRTLLLDVLDTPDLAKKLVGMQLLIETNAVVIFKRLGETNVCPVLTELLPYFERDESRHVGLGVLYLPRLMERMGRAERTALGLFQGRCLALLIASGMALAEHFEALGMDQRTMTARVTSMQDDVVRQMRAAHGRGAVRAVLNPKASAFGPRLLDFLHPEGGVAQAKPLHRAIHGGMTRVAIALDRRGARSGAPQDGRALA